MTSGIHHISATVDPEPLLKKTPHVRSGRPPAFFWLAIPSFFTIGTLRRRLVDVSSDASCYSRAKRTFSSPCREPPSLQSVPRQQVATLSSAMTLSLSCLQPHAGLQCSRIPHNPLTQQRAKIALFPLTQDPCQHVVVALRSRRQRRKERPHRRS